jgi:ribosomal protein S27AE
MSEVTKYLVDCNRLVRGRKQSSECDVYVVLATDYDTLAAENKRLRDCLSKANGQTEHFERNWYLVSDERDQLRAELAAMKGEQGAWKLNPMLGRCGLVQFMTQAKYEAQTPKIKQWYQPYRCAACAAPQQPGQDVAAAMTFAQFVEVAAKLLDAEQQRLTDEDNYLMDSDDCVKVLREHVAAHDKQSGEAKP